MSVTHVSPPTAHVVKEKMTFLVSLSTLSNLDRELHKAAVLSAREHTESWILLFAAMSGDYCCSFMW